MDWWPLSDSSSGFSWASTTPWRFRASACGVPSRWCFGSDVWMRIFDLAAHTATRADMAAMRAVCRWARTCWWPQWLGDPVEPLANVPFAHGITDLVFECTAAEQRCHVHVQGLWTAYSAQYPWQNLSPWGVARFEIEEALVHARPGLSSYSIVCVQSIALTSHEWTAAATHIGWQRMCIDKPTDGIRYSALRIRAIDVGPLVEQHAIDRVRQHTAQSWGVLGDVERDLWTRWHNRVRQVRKTHLCNECPGQDATRFFDFTDDWWSDDWLD